MHCLMREGRVNPVLYSTPDTLTHRCRTKSYTGNQRPRPPMINAVPLDSAEQNVILLKYYQEEGQHAGNQQRAGDDPP